jgi:hypothetical protein
MNNPVQHTTNALADLLGGIVQPITRTPDEQRELEWIMAYVAKHGQQPA